MFHNDGIKTVSKGSTVMILKMSCNVLIKSLKRILDDGTKKTP